MPKESSMPNKAVKKMRKGAMKKIKGGIVVPEGGPPGKKRR
jgi:hypothetical protein